VQRLRHILLSFEVWVIARIDPLKYLFEKPVLNGRLSRWLALLAQFELVYVTQKSIKGRAISEYCAENPISGQALNDEFPDEDLFVIT